MAFKLTGKEHKEALSLDGSQLFDPSKKERPMIGWLQIPFEYADKWGKYAKAPFDYVKTNS